MISIEKYLPELTRYRMTTGVGNFKDTACVVAQAAIVDALRRGESLTKPTDSLECASPTLRSIAIAANDINWWSSDTERSQVLTPLIGLLIDSRGTKEIENRRMFMLADYSVRVSAANAMEYAGLKDEAEKLRALPEILDAEYAKYAAEYAKYAKYAAKYAAESAEYAKYAAKYAAESAEYAAKSAAESAKIIRAQRDSWLALFYKIEAIA